MFEDNILTFNPGWVDETTGDAGFEDIRRIQARLEAAGLTLDTRADPEGTGPAHVILKDPDGNTIMLDQHVPAP
jgi:catechol 2,3-dioxygenase-like lactoylglutathione lyase family enzyme